MRVSDLMTAPVITVGPGASLKRVAHELVDHAITGVPVVEDGRVIGIVSQANIVDREREAEAESLLAKRKLRLRRSAAQAAARTARDVMTSPAVTIDPHASAVGAAWLMTKHDVNRLPVVENEQLVGIVTRSDIVRAFVRSDDEIRREIVDEVLPSLLVSQNDVEVTVEQGIVHLSGEVEDDAEVRCLPHAVRGVLGVVDVAAELTGRHPHAAFDRASEAL
jgi:CBS domain-containing protein